MASSDSRQSIGHPIFVEITKALGAAVEGKLSDYAISQILHVIIDYQDQQLSLGLFGPYTENTTLRSIPPGLKRRGTNQAMLVKEVEGAWDKP